ALQDRDPFVAQLALGKQARELYDDALLRFRSRAVEGDDLRLGEKACLFQNARERSRLGIDELQNRFRITQRPVPPGIQRLEKRAHALFGMQSRGVEASPLRKQTENLRDLVDRPVEA